MYAGDLLFGYGYRWTVLLPRSAKSAAFRR
jgi:hypothetical protein